MTDEIKTEDIIKSMRICIDPIVGCSGCAFSNFESPICWYTMENVAADRLEQLSNLCSEEDLMLKEFCSQTCKINQKIDDLIKDTEDDDDRIMRKAIETYGVQAQCDVAIEEMAELTKAIMKIRRVADDYEKTQPALDNLLEEIADVDIMVDQLKIMWGPREVEEYRNKKLERLKRRLK